MKVLTLTHTTNKDIFVGIDVFYSITTATKEWNGIMFEHKEDLLQVEEVEEELKDHASLLFIYKDGFGRKQSCQLRYTKVTV